jgi:hypothetical protein
MKPRGAMISGTDDIGIDGVFRTSRELMVLTTWSTIMKIRRCKLRINARLTMRYRLLLGQNTPIQLWNPGGSWSYLRVFLRDSRDRRKLLEDVRPWGRRGTLRHFTRVLLKGSFPKHLEFSILFVF